jgi:hypothetical protein
MTEKFLPPYYAEALGLATITWALFESVLDVLVAITFHECGGKQKHKEMPRSLSRKVDYFRERAKPEHVADKFADRLRAVANVAAELGDKRHEAIHGALQAISSDGTVTLARFLYEKTMHRAVDVTVTASDIALLSEKIRDETQLALGLASEMFAHFVEKPSN